MSVNVGDLLAVLKLQDDLTPIAITIATKTLPDVDKAAQSTAYQLTLLGRGLREAGVIATSLFTAPFVAATEAVIKFGGGFETEMTKVVTLAGATTEEVASLRQGVLDLSTSVGVGASNLAKGLFVIESFGQTGAQAMDTLTVAGKMAALGMGDTAETARGLTGAIFAYRNQNLSAAEAGDILTRTVQLGNMRISELVPALARVNPIAASMGVKFEEVAASIATFTHAGVDSAMAATGIRAVLNSILTDSAKTEKGFKALAEATGDQTISMANFRKELTEKGLTSAMISLTENVSKAGEAGVTAFGQIIPNIRGLTEAMAVYLQNGGMVVDITGKMIHSQGTLDKSTQELHKTWQYQWGQMQAEVEKMWIKLGDAGLLDVLKQMLAVFKEDVVPVLQTVIKIFSDLPRPIQYAMFILAGFFGILGPGIMLIGQLVMAIGNISRALPVLVKGIESVTGALAGMTAGGALKAVIGFLMSPWVLIAAGVAAVAYALYQMNESTNEAVKLIHEQTQLNNDWITVNRLFREEATLTTKGQKELADALERVNDAHHKGKPTTVDLTTGIENFGLVLNRSNQLIQTHVGGVIAAAKAQQSFADQVNALTAGQRAEIEAGVAAGYSHARIYAEMVKVGDATGITTEIIGVYEKQLKSATTAAKQQSEAETKFANDSARLATTTERLWAEYYTSKAKLEGDSLSALNANTEKWYATQKGVIDAAEAAGIDVSDARIALDAANNMRLDENANQHAAHTQKITDEITAMWSEYDKAIAKGDNDTLAIRLAVVDKWYIQNVSAIAKAARTNIDELTRLDSLNATYYARRESAEKSFNEARNADVFKFDSAVDQSSQNIQAIWHQTYSILSKMDGDSVTAKIENARQEAIRAEAISSGHYSALLEDLKKNTRLSLDEKKMYHDQIIDLADNEAIAINARLEAQIAQVKRLNDAWHQTVSILGSLSSMAGTLSGLGAPGSKLNTGANNVGQALGAGASITSGMIALQSAMAGPAALMAGMIPLVGGFVAIGVLVKHALDNPVWKQMMKSVGSEWGLSITDGMAKQLEADAKTLGSTEAAKIFNLKTILGDNLNSKNLDFFTAKLHDVFSAVQLGQMTTAQGAKVLDDNWSNFVKTATDGAGLLSPAMVQLEKLNDLFKTGSKEIASYRAGQISIASSGLAGALKATDDAYSKSSDLRDKLAELQTRMGDSNNSPQDIASIQKDLIDLNSQLRVQQDIIDATGIHSQAAATGMSGAIIGIIDANLKAGQSFIQAVRGAEPSITALQKQLDATGYSGGAAFALISKEADLANDAVAGPALTSIEGYTAAIVGLSNAGMLTQDVFGGLASQISDTYSTLIGQGKDANSVLLAMAPDLQVLWEEQHRFGLKVDDSTQALINQAVAAGLVGEAHKDSTEQIVDSLNHVARTLDLIAEKWEVILEKSGAAPNVGNGLGVSSGGTDLGLGASSKQGGTVNVSLTVQAIDGQNVEDWLRNGADTQIARAITRVAQENSLV